jgi:predicted AAA+ superfamily ATPase
MTFATNERVDKALRLLTQGLTPYVEAKMKARHGNGWRVQASRAGGGDPRAPLDAYGLLKTMLDNWQTVFGIDLNRAARNFVSQALDGRNAWAHATATLNPVETLRALDAMSETLAAISAKQLAAQVRSLHEEQIRDAGPAVAAVPEPKPQGDLLAIPAAAARLKPWREVAIPHPDVLESRFKDAEFAADLATVEMGRAAGEYLYPADFFRITFLTKGLERVLALACQRLTGSGGEPVIGLQTPFGGGKTHTMLALYHLAGAEDPRALPGMGGVLDQAGVTQWRPAKRFVFVGTAHGPRQRLSRQDEPALRTPWGLMAWRLAGQAGLDIVGEAEGTGANPGSERLVRLFELASPCLVLFDELVAYSRQLEGSAYEAFLSFTQSLTEAVKVVPGALVLGSLPESAAEAGGPVGLDALRRLEKIFGRVQSAWMPARGRETYEIIRRRLFQELDAEGTRARDATVRAFTELYRENRSEFPPECAEPNYRELLTLAYPIHPELFALLSGTWGGLEKFQRTRGVLRLMANVIYALWRSDDRNPMILPGSLPLRDERVRSGVLDPLQDAFQSALETEVEGEAARPQQIEARRQAYGRVQALTRATRAVFMATAPRSGLANPGITTAQARLGCALPGDQVSIFSDSLRELADSAAYLHREGDTYYFSAIPTLNSLATQKAAAFPAERVDTAIIELLAQDARTKGSFSRVHAAPEGSSGVEDERTLGLVILPPAASHIVRPVGDTAAFTLASEILEKRGAAQREYRNVLLFVAADATKLEEAQRAVRRWLAWAEIETQSQALSGSQIAEAGRRRTEARAAAERAVRAGWSHLIVPIMPDKEASGASRGYELHAATILNSSGEKPIALAAYDKAIREGAFAEKLGGQVLGYKLQELIGSEPHLRVRDVAEWTARYVHMKRVRDEPVLVRAIEELVGDTDPLFAFARGWDPVKSTYEGLTLAKSATIDLRGDGLLVRRDVAEKQLRAEEQRPVEPTGDGSRSGDGGTGEREPTSGPGPQQPGPRRFFGVITLDATRPGPQISQIAQAIVAELSRVGGTRVTLRLDIDAEAPGDFPSDVIDVVNANAKTLKFEQSGFS